MVEMIYISKHCRKLVEVLAGIFGWFFRWNNGIHFCMSSSTFSRIRVCCTNKDADCLNTEVILSRSFHSNVPRIIPFSSFLFPSVLSFFKPIRGLYCPSVSLSNYNNRMRKENPKTISSITETTFL